MQPIYSRISPPYYDAQNVLTGGKYAQLPRLVIDEKPVVKILCKTHKIILDVLLIRPILLLIMTFWSRLILFYEIESINDKKLSPLAKLRLTEMKSRVQALAKKAGIANPQKLKVFTFCCLGGPIAASSDSKTIIVRIEELVKPQDLPSELQLERVDRREISEEEWVVKFRQWTTQNFLIENSIKKSYKSQAHVDLDIAFGKYFLKQFRNYEQNKRTLDAIIGHELGHCKNNHATKRTWAAFGWRLLSPFTLGISSFFENRVLNKLSQRYEKESDLFSAKKCHGAEALSNFLYSYLDISKSLHRKYPEVYDSRGNNLKDKRHPLLSDRITYLTRVIR